MEYRRLGDAGMKVSAVALGGWINFGEGKVAQDDARAVVETAYEAGIRYFDLADQYGYGEAEKQMGALLKQYPRKTLVVASKVFWPMSEDPNDRGLSRKHIMESIDGTLQRLGMDYIDIYFCHRPDPETPIYETVRAMNDVVTRGKALYWGTSVWSAEQLQEAYDICDQEHLYKPQAEQPPYSLLVRDVERDVLPMVRQHGTGIVAFSPLAQGMLTGKYDEGIPAGTRFARESWAAEQFATAQSREKVQQLKPIAERLGITRSQLALAWLLHQPGVSSVITGATKADQVKENVSAAEVKLPEDVVNEIERIFQ